MSLVEETKTQGSVGRKPELKAVERQVPELVQSRDEAKAGVNEDLRPEEAGLEWLAKEIKTCFQSGVHEVFMCVCEPRNYTKRCVYVYFSWRKGQKYHHIFRKLRTPQSYYPWRLQGAGTICPRLGVVASRCIVPSEPQQGLHFRWQSASQKNVCAFSSKSRQEMTNDKCIMLCAGNKTRQLSSI